MVITLTSLLRMTKAQPDTSRPISLRVLDAVYWTREPINFNAIVRSTCAHKEEVRVATAALEYLVGNAAVQRVHGDAGPLYAWIGEEPLNVYAWRLAKVAVPAQPSVTTQQ